MGESAKSRGRPRNADKTREVILDAAEATFAERGFDGARLDAIAEAADYNKSLIGQYFGDKLGLYVEVLKRIDREMSELQSGVLLPAFRDGAATRSSASFKAFLKTMAGALFDYQLEHPRFVSILTWEMAAGWRTYEKIAPR
jgi:AcrR family transcriptional regulator